jgi:choline dehydrogenase
VEVVHHLPGVGANLQDHLELYVAQECTRPITLYSDQKGLRMLRVGIQWFLNQTGPAASAHLETGGFFRSSAGVEHPDIQAHFLPSQVQCTQAHFLPII